MYYKSNIVWIVAKSLEQTPVNSNKDTKEGTIVIPKPKKPLTASEKSGFAALRGMLGNSTFQEFDTKGNYGKSKYDKEIVVGRDINIDNLKESIEEESIEEESSFNSIKTRLSNMETQQYDTIGNYGESEYEKAIIFDNETNFNNIEESFEEKRDYYRQESIDNALNITVFILFFVVIILIISIIVRKIRMYNNDLSKNNNLDSQIVQTLNKVNNDYEDSRLNKSLNSDNNNLVLKENNSITEFTLRFIKIIKSYRNPENKIFTILNLSKDIIEIRSSLIVPVSFLNLINLNYADNFIMQVFSMLFFEAKLTNDTFFIENKQLVLQSG